MKFLFSYLKSNRVLMYVCTLFLFLSFTLGTSAQTPSFKVIAFYSGTYDLAHINFVNEAKVWFPQLAAQNNFTWESTNNWSNLNATFLSQYKVVMFLDDQPPTAQHAAFEQYMNNGGAWMGFHVSAFNTNPANWDWYHNQFLGTGAFSTNTWGPTTAVLKCEDNTHPSTTRLPATFTSAVSEWYGWNNDLRNNANIKILCSIDPSSFPLGTDPGQTWYSGYYPIIWTNKNYKMLYANFGHNAMNYATNTGLSSTFGSEIQNRFLLDGLLWLGGATSAPTAIAIPGTAEAENYTAMSGVQKETTTDTGGGQNVGYIDANDWMDYNVNVTTAGTYNVQYRVASLNGGGSIQLRNGTTTLATTAITTSGGWQTWKTTANATVNLIAGTQTLRIYAGSGGFNLNWIKFTPESAVTPPIGQVITLRGSNGNYVGGEDGLSPMMCNHQTASSYESFTLLDAGGGKVALRSKGKYASSENGTQAMRCNRASIGDWEKFDWIFNADGSISLKGFNGKYVSSENGTQGMTCTRLAIGGWETFNYSVPGAGAQTMAINTKTSSISLLNEVTKTQTSAYPNPFENQLNYTVPSEYSNHSIVIYDLQGKKHVSLSVKGKNTNNSIDTHALPKGLYILDITSGNYHKKIKVEKK